MTIGNCALNRDQATEITLYLFLWDNVTQADLILVNQKADDRRDNLMIKTKPYPELDARKRVVATTNSQFEFVVGP